MGNKIKFAEKWESVYEKWKAGDMTMSRAARQLGLKRTTVDRKFRERRLLATRQEAEGSIRKNRDEQVRVRKEYNMTPSLFEAMQDRGEYGTD